MTEPSNDLFDIGLGLVVVAFIMASIIRYMNAGLFLTVLLHLSAGLVLIVGIILITEKGPL